MPLRSLAQARQRAQAGVEVCTAHWPHCPKYPDHPLIREANKLDAELAKMIRSGFQKLGRPIPSFGPECKTRKLSDDELRKRREYVDAYREARDKKQVPPRPPWVNPEADHDLIERIREGRAQQALERHTTDVREGYGDTVPEFEEME